MFRSGIGNCANLHLTHPVFYLGKWCLSPCRIPEPVSMLPESPQSITSIVPLWTKQAANVETHQKLINAPVIDQLNSSSPHDFLNVYLDLFPPRLLSVFAPVSHTFHDSNRSHFVFHICIRVRQEWNEMLVFSGLKLLPGLLLNFEWSGDFVGGSIIEIPHLILKVSLPRFGLSCLDL